MNLLHTFEHWQQIVFILFCVIATIQIFYFLFFFSRLAFYNPNDKNTTQTHAVSVVICARDELINLENNLPSVLNQSYDSTHEVIVVNDNSFDDSKYILEELKSKYKQLQIIELTQEAMMIPGKKFPLAVGIKSSKHEILLLTDADCIPATSSWIESMQSKYDDKTEIVLGYGAFHKLKGFFNKIVRWECFQTALQYMSYSLAHIPYMGVGRNLSYKKSVFLRHKGFSSHNNIPGGDDDLFINMAVTQGNTKINIDKDSFTLSNPPESWGKWKRQKNRHYTTSKYYKKIHQFLLGLYSISHFLFYPLLISSAVLYNWKYTVLLFIIRFLIQAVVYYKSMKKLNETDLFPFFFILDIWMFFYYLLFASSLFKKPVQHWK
jgi:glycosyltransferase involved in cell wall biosynthesis